MLGPINTTRPVTWFRGRTWKQGHARPLPGVWLCWRVQGWPRALHTPTLEAPRQGPCSPLPCHRQLHQTPNPYPAALRSAINTASSIIL